MSKFVVIDVETTGQLPTEGDRIIELALVVIEDNQIIEEYNQFINPEKSIPPFITQLTTITNKDVENEPTFEEIVGDIKPILKNAVIVAHNATFDLNFLNAELERVGETRINPYVMDTVELSRILIPKAPSYKLNELAKSLMISHDNPHRAISDALVTADLFVLLTHKLSSLPKQVVDQLMTLSQSLQSDLFLFHHEIKGQNKREDIVQYRGICLKKEEEKKNNFSFNHPDFASYLDELYDEGGHLSEIMNDYEKRDGQVLISETIYNHFRVNKHALIEAETGLGKTVAYLIPAVYEAISFNEKMVISTTNTNLQSQLIEKDLRKLSIPISTAVVKGKNHYLSLEKFEKFLKDNSFNSYQDILLKAMLLVWLTETNTGDLDEIHLSTEKNPIFYQIIINHYPTNDVWKDFCFYHKVRKNAEKAQIIVTNHALLSIDMTSNVPILPDYERLIIDEAHQLVPIATHFLGESFSYVELVAILQQLVKKKTEHSISMSLLDELKYESDLLFRQLFQYVKLNNKDMKSITETGRLKAVWNPTNQTEIMDALDRVLLLMQQIGEVREQEKVEIDVLFDRLQNRLHFLLKEDHTKSVTWLEIEQYGAENAVFIRNEPFSIHQELSDYLIHKKKSIIFISATLTMNQSFTYIRNKLGLGKTLVDEYQIDDYFDYQENVQLKIPNNLPPIRYPNNDDFIYALNEAIISIAERTEKKILVLFTSYEMLRKSYFILKESDELHDYMIIGQGVSTGSRNRLIKQFQSFDKAILLGTNAYWQGIDIPGEDLSCLIIVKLPFQSPQDPVYIKKADYYKARGVNPFMELALPKAVLQFKQGFGRLIRKKTDKGIVFVFDDRLMTKKYGKTFIQSIPQMPIQYDNMEKLLDDVDKWRS